MPRIALIGFMGTGKSTIGALLAKELGWRHKDSDAEIVACEGRSIADIFAEEGEEYFRLREKEALARLLEEDRLVISTGGGAILFPENRELLQKESYLVSLQANPETIIKRLAKDEERRPLLEVENPEEKVLRLLRFREDYYACCNLRLDTEGLTPEECARIILKRWKEYAADEQ